MFIWKSLDINVALFERKRKESPSFICVFLSGKIFLKRKEAAALHLPQATGVSCILPFSLSFYKEPHSLCSQVWGNLESDVLLPVF